MTLQRSQFGPIDVEYDDEVLVPRPWTLEQSRWAVTLLGDLPPGPVLELCAGAGQIGLVVAHETGRALAISSALWALDLIELRHFFDGRA